MEPPRKKQKLSAEQSTLPLLPELRAEILRYLQPDRTIRLRWNIQSVKSALLKISETIAPKLRVYDSLHDRVADEVMEILVELCSVEFRFDQEVLYGFGFALGAGCDFNKAATEDLKDFKEVELHLPRLELRYESMAPQSMPMDRRNTRQIEPISSRSSAISHLCNTSPSMLL